ncbi:MAG: BRCT domain-containing protein [Planctomycetota bacterium]
MISLLSRAKFWLGPLALLAIAGWSLYFVDRATCNRPEVRSEPITEKLSELGPLSFRPEIPEIVVVGALPEEVRRQAERRVEDIGGRIVSEVQVNTSFLVVGEADGVEEDPTETEEYQRALRFGVQIVSADELKRWAERKK